MRFYAATSNPGKLRDFAWAAQGHGGTEGIEIEPLPGVKEIPPPVEDESTFEGNARLKAIEYSRFAPGFLVIADDSGLEVRCLGGAPGVRSARYADDVGFPHATAATIDERNNAALLRALDAFPESCREGRYRCVLAVARDGEVLRTAEGMVEGLVLGAPHGEGGFGYDPLFFVPELGVTMAEASPAQRLSVSHRGRALRKLLDEM